MVLEHCPLPGIGCIEADGADATAFLHAQLSAAIVGLDSSRAPLAGWLDARGRVRALFRVVRLPERWLLITTRDAVEPAASAMGRFVLRARVTLSPGRGWRGAALLGSASRWLLERDVRLGEQAGSTTTQDGIPWVRVGAELVHAYAPDASVERALAGLAPGGPERAELAEIRLGLPAVAHACADRFLPQMLNLDTLGAVAFDKGCYPGQEVVNRVRNLGSVKRRMRRFSVALSEPPNPGAAVLDADGAEAGEVVRAARAGDAVELLAVVSTAAVAGALCVDAAQRAPLTELPLPYPLD